MGDGDSDGVTKRKPYTKYNVLQGYSDPGCWFYLVFYYLTCICCCRTKVEMFCLPHSWLLADLNICISGLLYPDQREVCSVLSHTENFPGIDHPGHHRSLHSHSNYCLLLFLTSTIIKSLLLSKGTFLLYYIVLHCIALYCIALYCIAL